MKIATVDVGTNSTRLLISEIKNGKVQEIFKTGKVTRLGQGVREKKKLSKEGIERTINALKEFKEIIENHCVEKVIVVTTEAARVAENASEFLSAATELGFKVEILQDKEEAELVFWANVLHFNPNRKAMTVDLGGGSTEIVYGSKEEIEFLRSLKFGVVVLHETFIKSDPPKEEELLKMENFIGEELSKIRPEIKEKPVVYAVGGTITSVVAMEEGMEVYRPEIVHGYTVTEEMVERWYRELSSMTLEERKKVKGLEEKRADVIIPGLAFFKVFCKVFEVKELTVSELGLLYALALKEALKCR
ncbi:MAG: Ppx/GppA family phosphatase [Desulfurobacterium sp.]|nr:MAG: Ppx/GppA family phosphatase [Desulfurobacterium sp.]